MALPFLTLYFTRELHWPAQRAAAIVTLYGAVAFLVAPIAGRLCDRWGTRRLMGATLTASGLIMLVFPLARGFGSVALLTVAWALAGESFRPANMTAITESAPPEQRKQAYALHRAAINLGMSAGPAIGGFLATASFSMIWIVDGATTLMAAGVLAAFLDEARPAPGAGGSAAPSARALSDPKLLSCLLGCVLISLVFFQHESALPLHLVGGLGLRPSFYGLLFTVNTGLIVALEIPLNHATARWSHRRTMAVGAALFAVGFGGYGLCREAWHVVAATVVWTFGEMILMPGMSNYIGSIAPADRRGEYMGLYLTAFGLGFMLGPLAGVSLLERAGPGALWAAAFAIGAAATAVFASVDHGAEVR